MSNWRDSLSDRERCVLAADVSFVRERLEKQPGWSDDEAEFAEAEFRKFIILVLREPGPLAMIDKRVDEFWHMFILFTPQYSGFCNDIVGFFVHHQPRTSSTPVPPEAVRNFVEAYRRHFGEIPDVWLENVPDPVRAGIQSGIIPETAAFDWSGWTGRDFRDWKL